MNFRTFLEMGDLSQRNTDIEIISKPHYSPEDKYAEFTYEGQKFSISFYKAEINLAGNEIENAWGITFKQGYVTTVTNKAGTKSHGIYTQLLLAVKKFLETTPVDAIRFTGGEYSMDIIYDRFYKQYLSKNFIRINSEEYIKKSYLKQILEQHPKLKPIIYQGILDDNRYWRNKLAKEKETKNQTRKRKIFAKQQLGSFVYVDSDKKVSFIYDLNDYAIHALIDYPRKVLNKIAYIADIQLEPVPTAEIKQFLQRLNLHEPDIYQVLTTNSLLKNALQLYGFPTK